MVVDDDEAASIDPPFGRALIGRAERMQLSDGTLDTRSCEFALRQALFGVNRPLEVLDRHRLPKVGPAWDA
jgi:hypothetical protein